MPVKSVVIKPGQCAVCSKPLGKYGWVQWHTHAAVHHACMPRIAKATYVNNRQVVK